MTRIVGRHHFLEYATKSKFRPGIRIRPDSLHLSLATPCPRRAPVAAFQTPVPSPLLLVTLSMRFAKGEIWFHV
jgi:hypothetical protein